MSKLVEWVTHFPQPGISNRQYLITKCNMILLWIQPTGRIHIGNYFGVLEHWLYLQQRNPLTILIANYHAGSNEEDTKKFYQTIEKLWFEVIAKQRPNVLELFYQLAHTEMVAELAFTTVCYERENNTYALLPTPYGLWYYHFLSRWSTHWRRPV